jgi:hypothetical protein
VNFLEHEYKDSKNKYNALSILKSVKVSKVICFFIEMSLSDENSQPSLLKSFETFFSSTIKDMVSEKQISEWKRIFEETMIESTNAGSPNFTVLCERVVSTIDKYFTTAEKKVLLQSELQSCFETMYNEYFSGRYRYNSSINSFYDCRSGSLEVVASDEIFFSVRDKFPESAPPLHINLIWKMLKSRVKSEHWLQFIPSSEWQQKCLEYAMSLVESEKEAKMLLYIIGASINQTSVENTTFIWLGRDNSTRDVNAFFQRLGYKFAYVTGFGNQLLSQVKYSYKPMYLASGHSLIFLRFKDASMKRSFALIENNVATFLCCCSFFASTNIGYHSMETSLCLLNTYLPSLEENVIGDYITSNVSDSKSTSTRHLVHVKELYDDYIAFLETKKLPLNLIGQENFKQLVLSKLEKYEDTKNNLTFITGSIQLPTLYSQFHEFCQECIQLDDRIYVDGDTVRLTTSNNDNIDSTIEEKKAIQKAYKSYKSWYLKRFRNESPVLGHDLLEEEDEHMITSRTKITAKVFDCFALFKYGKNISHIHVSDEHLSILPSPNILASTLQGNTDISEIITSELLIWSTSASTSSSVAT